MPPKKKVKLSNDVTIQKLPEALLAKIFSYLPLRERYQISAVCRQWQSVSRIPWTDITHLNSSSIPDNKIKAILDLCPKIEHFVAYQRTLDLAENQRLFASPNLSSLRLFNVELSFQRAGGEARDRAKFGQLVAEFFERLPKLEELVWQNVHVVDYVGKLPARTLAAREKQYSFMNQVEIPMASVMAASLRRLKIASDSDFIVRRVDIMTALAQMTNLECLHLEVSIQLGPDRCVESLHKGVVAQWWEDLSKLSKLKELCIADAELIAFNRRRPSLKDLARVACEHLPQLEVLMFASDTLMEPEGISRLVTTHSALRILVLAGYDFDLSAPGVPPFVVPPRTTGSALLHVFVGGYIIRKLRFTRPEANTTRFWLIDCEMPTFLARAEVAEVFQGVWLAEIMRQPGQFGAYWGAWGGPYDSECFFTVDPGRSGLRSRSALLDNYWPEAHLRRDN